VTVEIGTVDGNGSGTITSSPAGIHCTVNAGVKTGDCIKNFTFPTSQTTLSVTLTATAATGSGACQKYCSMDSDYKPTTSIEATGMPDGYKWTENLFSFRLTKQSLSVTKTGAGTGKVTSQPAGIDCGATCAGSFDYGTQVSLTATPDAGAVFKTWTGACNGQGATCKLTVTAETSTNAVFELPTADGGTTDTGGAGTGGTTGGGAAGGGGQEADAAVEVDVIGATGGKSRIGRRVVRLELSLDEKVSATLMLVRGGKTVVKKTIANVSAGDRVLTILVPKRMAKGKASLRFALTDAAGNTFVGKRGIRIPAK
jgi:hypothetical protein